MCHTVIRDVQYGKTRVKYGTRVLYNLLCCKDWSWMVAHCTQQFKQKAIQHRLLLWILGFHFEVDPCGECHHNHLARTKQCAGLTCLDSMFCWFCSCFIDSAKSCIHKNTHAYLWFNDSDKTLHTQARICTKDVHTCALPSMQSPEGTKCVMYGTHTMRCSFWHHAAKSTCLGACVW